MGWTFWTSTGAADLPAFLNSLTGEIPPNVGPPDVAEDAEAKGNNSAYGLGSVAAAPKLPQLPRMPCRNFSRSSGVIRSQRSSKRRRNLERPGP
jgi:hypothetical protein